MNHQHTKAFYLFFTLAVISAFGIFTFAFFSINTRPRLETHFGVTYSWLYAQQLGLNPQETYKQIVNDLGVRTVRLPLYWSEIEEKEGEFDWTVPDKLVALSEEKGVDLTLVVGMKVPRWPECYIPDWAEKFSGTFQDRAVLSFIKEAVTHYKTSSAVVRWQVENEPFFPFGICPTISVGQFHERVDLVRSLDDRPIQVTVSGELGPWADTIQTADVLGISMYRETWNDLYGYFIYPVTPDYYFFRAQLVKNDVAKVIVSELQMEPWFPDPIDSRPISEWYAFFPQEMFQENIQFARDAGLSEVDLWGAEWWYALKQAGDDRLWESAKTVFESNR